MKVRIEDNLYLESDGLGFTIKSYRKPYTNKKGVLIEPSSVEGNYSNVQGATRHLLKMKLMESTAKDLKELLQSVEGIEQYIKDKVTV